MQTSASVTETAIKMPARPRRTDRSLAIGMISTNPLRMDTANASFGRAAELRNAAPTM